MRSQFEPKKNGSGKTYEALGNSKKSYIFGAGRDNFNKTVVNTNTMYPDGANPGPGTYTDGSLLIGVNARKTTLKERKFYLCPASNARKHDIPGPGTYDDALALHKEGIYVSSQCNNSKAARINTGRRWKELDDKQPGPGYYEENGQVAKGDHLCTNFHSVMTKNLATTASRTNWGGNPRFRTPGPGTYRPPSDFGYLDFKS